MVLMHNKNKTKMQNKTENIKFTNYSQTHNEAISIFSSSSEGSVRKFHLKSWFKMPFFAYQTDSIRKCDKQFL